MIQLSIPSHTVMTACFLSLEASMHEELYDYYYSAIKDLGFFVMVVEFLHLTSLYYLYLCIAEFVLFVPLYSQL